MINSLKKYYLNFNNDKFDPVSMRLFGSLSHIEHSYMLIKRYSLACDQFAKSIIANAREKLSGFMLEGISPQIAIAFLENHRSFLERACLEIDMGMHGAEISEPEFLNHEERIENLSRLLIEHYYTRVQEQILESEGIESMARVYDGIDRYLPRSVANQMLVCVALKYKKHSEWMIPPDRLKEIRPAIKKALRQAEAEKRAPKKSGMPIRYDGRKARWNDYSPR